MAAKILIFILAIITQALCNPNTFKYTENCAPPLGFNTSTTGSNATTVGPIYDDPMLPIERCCVDVEHCTDLGGSCILKWAVELYPQCCDFAPVEPCRDYSCKCCIRCGDDNCSPCTQTGGECRTHCRSGESEDTENVCLYHNNGGAGCKCCKSCEATHECTEAEGLCVTNPADCPLGTYPSTGCCGGCYCCKPGLVPLPGGSCDDEDAYCSESEVCAAGFFSCPGECIKTLHNGGLNKTELGYCCVPKQTSITGRRGMDQFLVNPAPFHHNIDELEEDHDRSASNTLIKHPRQLMI